jgi:hypothetical protein
MCAVGGTAAWFQLQDDATGQQARARANNSRIPRLGQRCAQPEMRPASWYREAARPRHRYRATRCPLVGKAGGAAR